MRKLILLTVLTLGATAARAENGFFYLGAGVVRNSLSDITALGGLPDLKNTSWKAYAGVRPLNWLAAEGDYIDLGSGSSSTTNGTGNVTAHANGSAVAVYAVGFLPIPLPIVDIFGKVGLAHWTATSAHWYRPEVSRATARNSPGASACRRTSPSSARAWNTRTSTCRTPAVRGSHRCRSSSICFDWLTAQPKLQAVAQKIQALKQTYDLKRYFF